MRAHMSSSVVVEPFVFAAVSVWFSSHSALTPGRLVLMVSHLANRAVMAWPSSQSRHA